MHPTVRKSLPVLIALVVYWLVSSVFFAPEAFQGKVLQQVDNQQTQAMSREARNLYKKDGKVRQWTETIFSGMPTTFIYQRNPGNLVRHVYYAMLLGRDMKSPSVQLYVVMLGMFLALWLFGVDWRLALLGGFAFGFGTYNMELLEAGHATKMVAVAYFPLVVASAWYAYHRNLLLGASLFGLSLGLQLYANHYQITYYTLLVLLILGVAELIGAIRQGRIGRFLRASALMVVFGLLCVGVNASKLWPAYEYAEESIRGKSELTSKPVREGLTEDYAFSWSYGIGETMTLLVPDFMGGGSSQSYRHTEAYKKFGPQLRANLAKQGITGRNADAMIDQQLGSLFYTGKQPFVGMGVYMGVIVFLLMLLGLVLAPDARKWWLLAALIFMLTLAWGGNFGLNKLWFKALPMFNKFRSWSMTLALVQGLAAVLAAMGLQAYFRAELTTRERLRGLRLAGGITVGILLVVLIGSAAFDYTGPNDARMGPQVVKILQADRMKMLRRDAMRGLLFSLLGIGVLYAFAKAKVKEQVAVILLAVLLVADMWPVAYRIINPSKFKTPKHHQASLDKSAADEQILQDKTLHYRVLDLSKGDPYRNALGANFHRMVGGYHPAKLMRYQELIERYLVKPTAHLNILSMLNTRYLIQNQGGKPAAVSLAGTAAGNAWFVSQYRIVETADAELDALDELEPKREAVLYKRYAGPLEHFTLQYDSTATIRLVSYDPDELVYEYSARTPQLAVFSEIYYPEEKGMSLTLDGRRIPLMKADYVLRAAVLPAGQHQKLVMKFHPRSYYLGEKIAWISSFLLLIALTAGIYFAWRQNQLKIKN